MCVSERVCVCVVVSNLSFTFTCWVLHKSCWAPNVPYLPRFNPEPARDSGGLRQAVKLCRACAAMSDRNINRPTHSYRLKPGLIPLLSETDMLCLPGFLSLSFSGFVECVSPAVLLGLEPCANGPLASLRLNIKVQPALQFSTIQHSTLY